MRAFLIVSLLATACHNDTHATPDAAKQNDAPFIDIDASPDAAAMISGQISVVNAHRANTNTSNASATFIDGSLYGTPIGSDGACTLYSQQGTPLTHSAGTIAIGGTAMAVTLTPSGSPPNVSYTESPKPLPYPAFTAGATITFTAPGADVPSFNGTVTAPAAVAGWTPPTMISRAAGYTATWTAGSGPKIWVIVALVTGMNANIALCKVDDTGTYKVATSTLALDTTATQAAVLIARVAESPVQVGSSTVYLQVVQTDQSNVIPLNP